VAKRYETRPPNITEIDPLTLLAGSTPDYSEHGGDEFMSRDCENLTAAHVTAVNVPQTYKLLKLLRPTLILQNLFDGQWRPMVS